MQRFVFALVLAAAAPAAAHQAAPVAATRTLVELAESATACTDPRPQMCTKNYQPVCATKRDGARQTYSNGCMACADANVVSHLPGPCS